MEASNDIKAVIERISNQQSLTFNEVAISAELKADALGYKGLGIKILTVAGGILASFFFLGFLATIFSSSQELLIALGIILIVVAIFINYVSDKLIVYTICICCYLAGYAALSFGLNRLLTDNGVALVILATALLVIPLTKGYMLTFFSVLVINGALAALINNSNTYILLHFLTAFIGGLYVLIVLHEPYLLSAGKNINIRYAPFQNAMLVSYGALLCFIAATDIDSRFFPYSWISTIIILALLLSALFKIARHINLSNNTTTVVLASVSVLIAPVIYFPSVGGAILLLILGWHTGQRLAQVAGVVILMYAVGMFYYNLGFTLLVKSGMMFGTGLLFLIAWFILRKKLKHYEKV